MSRRKTNKAQRELLKDQARVSYIELSNKITQEPKPRCIGNGLKRFDRQERESLLYQDDSRLKYLPRNMVDRNLDCFIQKAVNRRANKPKYEHLCLNWV